MPQTLDQQRAQYAWEKVMQIAQDLVKDYAREAKGAPALVMSSGLMQTLAFYNAKGKQQHASLRDHVCRWLGRTLGGTPIPNRQPFPHETNATFPNVMAALHAAPSSLYLRATDEALALLRWIRQFADARKSMEG